MPEVNEVKYGFQGKSRQEIRNALRPNVVKLPDGFEAPFEAVKRIATVIDRINANMGLGFGATELLTIFVLKCDNPRHPVKQNVVHALKAFGLMGPDGSIDDLTKRIAINLINNPIIQEAFSAHKDSAGKHEFDSDHEY